LFHSIDKDRDEDEKLVTELQYSFKIGQ